MGGVRWAAWLSALICALFAVMPPAQAEMKVRLKDGRVLTLPVERDAVQSIEFGDKGPPILLPNGDNNSPAARAARKEESALEESPAVANAILRAIDAAERAEKAAAAATDAVARAERAEQAAQALMDALRARAGQSQTPAPSAAQRPRPAPAPAISQPSPRQAARGRLLQVGPSHALKTPSAAAKQARDGDVVEIAAGTYPGDVAIWNAHNLELRGVGGRPHLAAGGGAAEGKAIWVIKGDNTIVENMEFSGARVADRNGAGIRLEGAGLIVRNSYFHDNEMGILTGTNLKSDIVIERSEFARNTVDYGKYARLGHNIYIGKVRSFTLRFSHVHHATTGHNVKSRALTNRILYNRLMDGDEGASSYIIDLPNGGASFVIGNIIHQSRDTDNWAAINYGNIGDNSDQRLFFINNTVLSDHPSGIYIQRKKPGQTVVMNNIFVGNARVLAGSGGKIANNLLVRRAGLLGGLLSGGAARPAKGELAGNLEAPRAGFVDPEKGDYRLGHDSPAIDQGANLTEADGEILAPRYQYAHPTDGKKRPRNGKMDIGAYEFAAPAR